MKKQNNSSSLQTKNKSKNFSNTSCYNRNSKLEAWLSYEEILETADTIEGMPFLKAKLRN
jgi:hypothetical protein